jgi:glucokinase
MTVLACDVGGTRIKLGIVESGRILASEIIAAESGRGLAQALPRMTETLRALCSRIGIRPAQCRGVGIGFPALVNCDEGRVLNEYGKYCDAPDQDLGAWARESFDLPLAVDNDARVALLGEWRFGAGMGTRNIAIATFGTGIGTAVAVDGKVLRGPHFQAGVLCGHLIVNAGGRACACGARGCVEAETGSAQLPERARASHGYAECLLAGQERIDYEVVCRGAAKGDAVCLALFHRATTLWGAMCTNMIHAFDLERIVLGGGIMESGGVILPAIREFVEKHANTPWGQVDIVAARQPNTMALAGCEVLVDELINRGRA